MIGAPSACSSRFEITEGEMSSAYESLHALQQHRRCVEVDAAFRDRWGDQLLVETHGAIHVQAQNQNVQHKLFIKDFWVLAR